MSFPPYPSYRDSGVEWLGRVPRKWTTAKLKHIASFSGGGTPSRDRASFWNGTIPWVSPKDMKSEVITATEEMITDEALAASATSLVPPGAILLVVRSGILRHTIPVAINAVAVSLNQDMKALRFTGSRCDPRFFSRWVQGLNNELILAWSKQGATVESIEQQYLAETVLVLPSLAEQSAIVAFLDRETAKIDALVDEQRRLIALLKEKRQAVISHAVTKGLDPTVHTKDSGVEWLGDVPLHWELAPLKRLVELQRGHDLPTQDRREGSIPVVSSGGYIGWHDHAVAHGPSIVTGRYGTIGNFILVEGPFWPLNTTLYSTNLNGDPRFVRYALENMAPLFLVNAAKSAVPGVDRNDLHRLLTTVPPTSEQRDIAAMLDALSESHAKLTNEAELAIDLLFERRAALISAAVTGRIDVCGAALARLVAA